MMQTQSLAPIWQELHAKIRPGVPSFFSLSARLPSLGRFDNAVAATERMTVMLKTYAAGGENTVHSHTHEDHLFVVLQGEATFRGPKGEVRSVAPLEGVMLPKGAFYSFVSSGDTALVMLRVGCVEPDVANPYARLGLDGRPMSGSSAENKHVDPVFSDEWFGKPVTKPEAASSEVSQ